ncbi:MAG TPA: hypothetical protein VJA16_23225 [Thermoanaerobaculia bacterium]
MRLRRITRSVTFAGGTGSTVSLGVTVTTATACVANQSVDVAIDRIAAVPTLGAFGFAMLAARSSPPSAAMPSIQRTTVPPPNT